MKKCKVDECAWYHEGYCSEEEDWGKDCTCKSNDELMTEEEWEARQKKASQPNGGE